jgi:hypothetical protein
MTRHDKHDKLPDLSVADPLGEIVRCALYISDDATEQIRYINICTGFRHSDDEIQNKIKEVHGNIALDDC